MPAVYLVCLTQRYPVLRSLGAGEARFDRAHIQFQRIRIQRIGLTRVSPHALFLCISFDQLNVFRRASGQFEIAQRFAVDREDGAGAAEFGRHVAECGPVGERQLIQPVAEELDEFPDHAFLAQHLGHGQDQVGRRRAFFQGSRQFKSDDMRDEHRNGLAEHRGFGLDAADAPAEYADAVDHGRMRIGADNRVRVGPVLTVFFDVEHDAPKVFEINLVHDAGIRRHDTEILERTLTPAQE